MHEGAPSIDSFHLQGFVWMYCKRHAGGQGNKRANCLSSIALILGTITIDKEDIVKTEYECLLVNSTKTK